jgi:lipopolysaccharide heptosyltransferase I
VKILLVRLGSLGDIVHGLPVASSLREAFPSARIDWVVDVRQRAIVDLVPVLDHRVVVEPSAGGFLKAALALREVGYDAAIDLQGLWKSALLARGSGAKRVIGFPAPHLREPGARVLYSETGADIAGPHVIQKNLSLLKPLGIDAARFVVAFPLETPKSTVLADAYGRLGVSIGDPFALINPGAAWPNKRWPPGRFGDIAAAMAARYQLRSVVLWGPGEQPLAEAVAAASRGAAVASPRTSVGDLVVLSRAARLMVSGDTGPLHIAAAAGTPIVGLFGPTDANRNGPWSPNDITLSRYTECVCHYRRRCRRAAPCLLDIETDEVMRAIDRRLSLARAHV